MKCEEFLDSIDGSENLTNAQKQHMNSCPSCKSAFIAATAFTSCRSPLSANEKMSIASISTAALNASNATSIATNSISQKPSLLSKYFITAIVVLAGSAALLISNLNIKAPISPTTKGPVKDKNHNEEIVIEKKINQLFSFGNQKPILNDENLTIQFSSPCSFIFTPDGLKIIKGRAYINKTKSNEALTILNGDLSFNIENATIEYTINNGIVFMKVISGSVRLINKNVVKYINKGEIWKTPLNNKHQGVIILPTDVEKLE